MSDVTEYLDAQEFEAEVDSIAAILRPVMDDVDTAISSEYGIFSAEIWCQDNHCNEYHLLLVPSCDVSRELQITTEKGPRFPNCEAGLFRCLWDIIAREFGDEAW